MMRAVGRLLATPLFLLLLAAPLCAQGIETATATVTPWSGWWWPAKTGELVLGYRNEAGPLVKHDRVTGAHASFWEEGHPYHFDSAGQDWWGHCHAWAAASILEPEPLHDVLLGGTTFHVGDIKGLLSEAHYSDRAVFYGQRFNGNPGDDFEDMYPVLVWYVLRKYLHDNQTPLVMDLDPGPQVWSYPVYEYSLGYWPIDAGTYQSEAAAALPLEKRPSAGSLPAGTGFYQGELALGVGSYLVHPDAVGTTNEKRTYDFVFAAQGNQPIQGSDHWIGTSVQDHPDFAWYPNEQAAENPELNYPWVSKLNLQAR